jgi:hypothetical protein
VARFADLVKNVLDTVTGSNGHLPGRTRQAIVHRADALVGGATPEGAPPLDLPPELTAHVDAVASHAWRITDNDVARLTRAGHPDDVIFEATVSAAVGAGTSRLRRALALLEEGR